MMNDKEFIDFIENTDIFDSEAELSNIKKTANRYKSDNNDNIEKDAGIKLPFIKNKSLLSKAKKTIKKDPIHFLGLSLPPVLATGALIGEKIEDAIDQKKIDMSFNAMMENYPELRSDYNENEIKRHFNTLKIHAPSLAKDPDASASFVKTLAGKVEGVSYKTIGDLSKIEEIKKGIKTKQPSSSSLIRDTSSAMSIAKSFKKKDNK